MIALAKRMQEVQTYYFAEKLRQIQTMNESGPEVINLGIGSPDLPPPAPVLERLKHVVDGDKMNSYQPYRGTQELRAAFSKWYKRYFDVDLDPSSEVLPLMGSKEGVMHIAMTFLDHGDQALIPDPGYPAYSSATEMAGAEGVTYPLKEELGWFPDLEAMGKMDLSRVKIMWINYPNMPTGACANRDLFRRLILFAKEHNILICHDNPYAFILNEEPLSILSVPGAIEHCIELNSLSKSHNMAGWRVGCLAGKQAYVDSIVRCKSNMDSGMYKGIQEGAIVALEQGPKWFNELNLKYAKRRVVARNIMELLGCTYSKESSGLFIWARIPQKMDSAKAYSEEILKKSRVFITPGHIFGSQGERFLRISLCSPEEVLQRAYQRILDEKKNQQSTPF